MCGLPPHEGQSCVQPVKWVNCEGSHTATSRDCPKFKEEYVIVQYKTLNKCSYSEAKSYVLRNSPKFQISYAKVFEKTTSSIPSVNEIAAILLSQIKNIVQEIISANMTALL